MSHWRVTAHEMSLQEYFRGCCNWCDVEEVRKCLDNVYQGPVLSPNEEFTNKHMRPGEFSIPLTHVCYDALWGNLPNSSERCLATAALLLDRGADVNNCDDQLRLVRLLLEYGADANGISHRGRTPLELANSHPRMRALLRKHCAIIVRKHVIGGSAEHPSRNRLKHLAPQIAAWLI